MSVGSSPLTRGKLPHRGGGRKAGRLIPAHAGKTACTTWQGPSRPAHPRSRGENGLLLRGVDRATGSSPLTRGKPRAKLGRPVLDRLIPAHAGKTVAASRTTTSLRAHPRSRGENVTNCFRASASAGSSPLTRGKQAEAGERVLGGGLIPAHAGKTVRSSSSMRISTAHPRSRGENVKRALLILGDEGSSPLTRGKHSLTCAFIKRIGQILESLELCASSGSYSLMDAYATDAPQDQARNTGLALPSSRAAS